MTLELWSDAPVSTALYVRPGVADELNPLLAREHYLGPLDSGQIVLVGLIDGRVVSGQVWRPPTSRRLPFDGSWLELSRWVLTAAAGENAGSRFHAASVKFLKSTTKAATLVSYSDPAVGHTGALYRACNWLWSPTWLRLRPPPSGQGSWGNDEISSVKDRWIFPLRKDAARSDILAVGDKASIKFWIKRATPDQLQLAIKSPALDLREAALAVQS